MEDAEILFYFFFIFCGMLIYSVIRRGVVCVRDNFLVDRFSILDYFNLMTKIAKRLRNYVVVKRLEAAYTLMGENSFTGHLRGLVLNKRNWNDLFVNVISA